MNGLQPTGPRSQAKPNEGDEEQAGDRATRNDAQLHKQPMTGQKASVGRRQTETTLLIFVRSQPALCLNADGTSERWRFIYEGHVFPTSPSLDSCLWVSASRPLPPPSSARLAPCHAHPPFHRPCWLGHTRQRTCRSLQLPDCPYSRHGLCVPLWRLGIQATFFRALQTGTYSTHYVTLSPEGHWTR